MKKTRFVCLSVLFISAFIGFASCSKRASRFEEASTMEAPMLMSRNASAKKMSMKADFAEDMMIESEAQFDSAGYGSSRESNSNEAGNVNAVEKKLIKTGNLSIETDNLEKSVAAVEAWAKGFGGFVSNSSCNERNAWFSVKVPSARFDEAMNSTDGIGRVLSHGTNIDDVSEQYYDLESRIKNKKIMKAKLEGYLSQAKDIKDLLQIERELNTVISNIDSMEGSLKRLSNQVQYSTISVNVSLPSHHDEHGFVFPDLKNGFSDFISLILEFFVGFFRILLIVIICGIPILAAIALFFWLLFGKIGIIRKLYNKLKK